MHYIGMEKIVIAEASITACEDARVLPSEQLVTVPIQFRKEQLTPHSSHIYVTVHE